MDFKRISYKAPGGAVYAKLKEQHAKVLTVMNIAKKSSINYCKVITDYNITNYNAVASSPTTSVQLSRCSLSSR